MGFWGFGVYDGHGGKIAIYILSYNIWYLGNEVAEYVRDHLINELKKNASFKNGDYEKCLVEIYLLIDELIKTPAGKAKL